ncbi:MAG: aldolase/citrate lyase family protein [Acidimicrobiia bacterium]|nr:aldolase/citrate lyase family protein [Acidimicrobiia bacterium]
MRENTLKTAWNEGSTTIGLWMATSDAAAAEPLGGLGYDYICLDLQHGLLDYADVVPILTALGSSTAVPLARAPWNEPGIIGKLLDAGSMGVIIPMVNSPAEAEQAVAACRYAPEGSRSWGPTRAASSLRGTSTDGADSGGYHEGANREIACIPMIETKAAVDDLEAILEVEGIDAVYVGPADLSLSYGLPPATDHPDSAVYQEALAKIVELSQARGVVPGIHTVPSLVQHRREQGFQMITATSNLLAQIAGARDSLAEARGEGGGAGSGSMY